MANRKMKDSGVEWIGKIPEGWSVTKNKYILEGMYSGGTPTASEEHFYCESGTPFVSISDMSAGGYVSSTKKSLTADGVNDKNLRVLPSGTILYSIYATIGAIAELRMDATISQAMLALFLKYGTDKEYYKFSLEAMRDYIFFTANGNTQFNLNAEKVWNFTFAQPQLDEQKLIAKYLDEKCAAIDNVLAKTQESIEEYKKLKQAVITEAVTKGVRGKRPMKDSGIDWIGQIPKEWLLTRKLSYICNGGISYGIVKLFDPDDINGVKVLRCSDVYEGGIDLSNIRTVTKEVSDEYRRTLLRGGEVLINVSGSLGGCAIASNDVIGFNIAREVASIPVNDSVCNRYVMYWLLSDCFKNYQYSNLLGSVYIRLNIELLSGAPILNPPKEEQQEIADYLDKKCAAIGRLISKKQQFIEELTAYKKSLIYEYVTGKKEVPA